MALSALFYFKATDTSNAFYDNTYKFTRDIAQLLVKIESGFGERLRHLDEGYSSMRNYLQNGSSNQTDNVERTKMKLESEEQEVEKVVAERNEIIQQLVERSHLQQEEKGQILSQLKAKEEELAQFQHEIAKLNRRLALERASRRAARDDLPSMESGISDFTFNNVIRKMGPDRVIALPSSIIRKKFSEIAGELPGGYIEDLEKYGFFDDGLTISGAKYLKTLAEKFRDHG
ncbi:hypothetical protein AAKU64_000989 [Undibacterium sp. GrIS 1.8]|uniref:hypothetical protein n=2 Tax=unclassified Undibacterium TaxID=2630295 RepID=UPI003393AFBC